MACSYLLRVEVLIVPPVLFGEGGVGGVKSNLKLRDGPNNSHP